MSLGKRYVDIDKATKPKVEYPTVSVFKQDASDARLDVRVEMKDLIHLRRIFEHVLTRFGDGQSREFTGTLQSLIDKIKWAKSLDVIHSYSFEFFNDKNLIERCLNMFLENWHLHGNTSKSDYIYLLALQVLSCVED